MLPKENLMEKRIIVLLLSVFVMMPLTNLFAEGQQEPAVSETVEFDFWTTETQSDRLATIQVLVDTYTTLYPDVKINLVPVDEKDLVSNVQTASIAGTLPALYEGTADMSVSFGSEGIIDIDATTALVEKLEKSKFYDGPLKMVETGEGGSYYALPYHGWVQGIW